LNTTVIVEVLPNGIKYKISIKIEIKELNMEPIMDNMDNQVELNNFIEENKQRLERLRNKRIQKNK
jgi:hypothetical protein